MQYSGADYWKNFSTYTPGYVAPSGNAGDQISQALSGAPVTCKTITLDFPFIDPQTGQSSYSQRQCLVPGTTTWLDAGLIERSGGAYSLDAEVQRILAAGNSLVGSDPTKGAASVTDSQEYTWTSRDPAGPSDGSIPGTKPSEGTTSATANPDNQGSTPGGAVVSKQANVTANTIVSDDLLTWMQANSNKNFANVDEWNYAFKALTGTTVTWEDIQGSSGLSDSSRSTAITAQSYLAMVKKWQTDAARTLQNGGGTVIGIPTTPGKVNTPEQVLAASQLQGACPTIVSLAQAEKWPTERAIAVVNDWMVNQSCDSAISVGRGGSPLGKGGSSSALIYLAVIAAVLIFME